MSKIKHVATCIVVDDDNFLILRRDKSTGGGGLWNFPGGSVESGEPLGLAAIRELEEEAGLIVEPKDIVYIGSLDRENMRIHFFITDQFSGQVNMNWESDAYAWIPLSEVDNYLFVGGGTLHPDVMSKIKTFMEG